jgi:hypothetical protein
VTDIGIVDIAQRAGERQNAMPENTQGHGSLATEPDRLSDVAKEIKRRLIQFQIIPKMFSNWPELVLFRLGFKKSRHG